MFLKEFSYVHQGCIYLKKKTYSKNSNFVKFYDSYIYIYYIYRYIYISIYIYIYIFKIYEMLFIPVMGKAVSAVNTPVLVSHV